LNRCVRGFGPGKQQLPVYNNGHEVRC
jgi:hypothetical protein